MRAHVHRMMASQRRVCLALFFLCVSRCLFCTAQDDLVGCGGFVRSDYLTHFSRIKVNLYTKTGAVKYRSECAPNNGYFLIPLYDKGEYVLKVEPPEGWTFEPSEVTLKVDGKSDLCSRGVDINFNHIGFSIYGQVHSIGSDSGPSGVTVSVTGPDGLHSQTETMKEGRFIVAGLAPGVHTVSASHPLWKMGQEVVKVEVVADSTTVPSGLIVLGYDVTGHVTSAGTPVAGVQLLLYSNSQTELDCKVPPTFPFPVTSDLDQPRCVALSQDDGVFSFPSLSPGHYTLVPHYRHEQIVFDVHPPRLSFTVANDSLTVEPSFEVQGFTVSGRVLFSQQGDGVGGAQVFVNSHLAATTDEEGSYTLSNITSGSYHLLVVAERLEFQEVVATITPSEPYLPGLTPFRFQVCGHVMLTVVPTASSSSKVSSGRSVEIAEGDMKMSVTADEEGKFCAMLRPGQYSFTPEVSPAEREWGLVFVPAIKDLTVTTSPSPSSSLAFSQFTASFSGTISCLESCPPSVPVTVSQGDTRETVSATSSSSGLASFSFPSLLPRSVHVSLDYPLWCLEVETITVEINPDHVPSVKFVQTGYVMSYTTSHDITVLAGRVNETGVEYSLEKGSGRKCLTAPGLYTITPQSCHKFQLDQYGFDTSFPAALDLKSVSHTVTATVLSPSPSADITLFVRSLRLGEEDKVVSASSEVIELVQEDSTKYLFHFNILAKPHDELEVVPQSLSLLFIPSYREFLVSEECPEKVPLFEGSQGLTLAGHVGPPPLEGVAITVTLEDGEDLHTTTNSQGLYRVGPIHGGKSYTVSAALSGYAFKPLPDDLLSFTSLRLGHIQIQVVESESGSPLSSVLLSLSGSHGFRSNNFTKPDGTLEYRDLIPGEYFLKPLLREFEFTPSSTSMTLEQGSVEEITYTGQRVAFGCAGRVMSLNGHALEGAVVMLTGSGGSECTVAEEATTGNDGQYLFRGLLPSCGYMVSVRDGGPNDIAHTLPSSRHIKLEGKDLVDVNFAAVFAIRDIYISGNVLTDPKHFPTLQVQVYSESRMGTPVTTAGVNSIGFFDLTPLLNRSEDYYIILDTNLPSHFYRFTRPEASVPGDRDSHITLTFNVQAIKYNEEHSHGSLVALGIAIIAIFAAVNFSKIYGLASGIIRKTDR